MTSRRLLAFTAASLFLFIASFSFSSSLFAAEGVTLLGNLVPPNGIVKGPVGTISGGNFTGPMLDGQNSVLAKFHYELDSAPTGQVYVGVWEPQSLLPRRLLGDQNINKGTGDVSIRFSLACTPGAPASSQVHKIEFGITRFNPPPTTAALPTIHHEMPVRFEFTCPAVKVTPKQMQPATAVH